MPNEMVEQQKQNLMQNIQTACIIAILVILVYTTFLAKPTPIMPPKYEYDIVWTHDGWGALEERGGQGWEIVNARWVRDEKDDMGYELILRRTIRN